MSESLVGFLAVKLGTHPENIATEALNYILRSKSARTGFGQLLSAFTGLNLDGVRFRTQITDALGARPDLIGEREDGAVVLTVEAKFWAGLTDNQPVQYLKNMPAGSVLLFVAPYKRVELLWDELKRRVTNSGCNVSVHDAVNADLRTASCGDKTLALTTWRAVLNCIAVAAEAAREASVSADALQLAGLCERMDSEAFLPLTSEELCPTIGRRVVQFGVIADDLANLMVQGGFASAKGRNVSQGNGWYGRYIQLQGCGALLHYSFWKWPKFGRSPLWLGLIGPGFTASTEFTNKLRGVLLKAEIEHFEWDDGYSIPIYLRTGVERDMLINDAMRQLLKVAEALQPLQLDNTQSGAPPSDDAESEIQGSNVLTGSLRFCYFERFPLLFG